MSCNSTQLKDTDIIDLSEIVAHLRNNRWLIMVVTGIVFVIGAIYAFVQVPLYQSNVLLQIASKPDPLAGLSKGMLGTVMGQKLGVSDNSESRQIALIKSRYILEPIIHSLGIDVRREYEQGFIMRYLSPRGEPSIQASLLRIPREWVDQRLKLKIDKTDKISLFSPQGSLVAQGALGDSISTKDKALRFKIISQQPAVDGTYFITKRPIADVMKKFLRKFSIKDLGGRDNTGVLELSMTDKDPDEIVQVLNKIALVAQTKDAEKKSRDASKTLEFLYQQLPISKNALEKSETALNHYRAKSGKIDIKIQSKALLMQLADLDKQLSALRLNQVEMLQKFTAAHPAMITFHLQIETLLKEKAQLEGVLKTLPASDQVAVGLMRDVKVKNTLYLLLLNKIQELQVMKAGAVSDINVLSYATPSDAPLSGNIGLICIASALLGFLISCLLILGRQLLFYHANASQAHDERIRAIRINAADAVMATRQ